MLPNKINAVVRSLPNRIIAPSSNFFMSRAIAIDISISTGIKKQEYLINTPVLIVNFQIIVNFP